MAFEVGKKYKRLRSDKIYNCLFSHDVAGGNWGTFDLEDDYIPRTHQWGADWSEYKEPRSITRWANIWMRPGGLNIGSPEYETEERARAAGQRLSSSSYKYIDTIEVKWVKKT